MFRNFDVRGGADRTFIYLTLFIAECLVKCEKFEDKPSGTLVVGSTHRFFVHFTLMSALRELKALAIKQGFLIPGDAGWPLGGLFPTPASKLEAGKIPSFLCFIDVFNIVVLE